jgi:azurin
MKMKIYSLLAASAVFALAGCGKSDSSSASAGSASASPASSTVSVELTAGDTMRYNQTTIEAKPGQEVKVSLTNVGTMPKTAMAHNFILLQKGTDPKAFVDAGATSTPAAEYIADSMKDKVLAHTKLLGPKESDEITFKAPTEPGEYTYLCSFPAHFVSGMKGTLVVK